MKMSHYSLTTPILQLFLMMPTLILFAKGHASTPQTLRVFVALCFTDTIQPILSLSALFIAAAEMAQAHGLQRATCLECEMVGVRRRTSVQIQ